MTDLLALKQDETAFKKSCAFLSKNPTSSAMATSFGLTVRVSSCLPVLLKIFVLKVPTYEPFAIFAILFCSE